MTPRGTDWGLATLVALLAFTGALTAFAGAPSPGATSALAIARVVADRAEAIV